MTDLLVVATAPENSVFQVVVRTLPHAEPAGFFINEQPYQRYDGEVVTLPIARLDKPGPLVFTRIQGPGMLADSTALSHYGLKDPWQLGSQGTYSPYID